MLTKEDMHTTHYPNTPLPFNIVNVMCGDCERKLYELNDYLPDSRVHDTVKITLHKDSAGRGWHIKNYEIIENKGDS